MAIPRQQVMIAQAIQVPIWPSKTARGDPMVDNSNSIVPNEAFLLLVVEIATVTAWL